MRRALRTSFQSAILVLLTIACGTSVEKPVNPADVLTDRTLQKSQIELLEVAFETATLIPVQPHIKDRSKAQESVIAACLKLGQAKRAYSWIDKIEDWRRGYCYADLAYYCAENGNREVVPQLLQLAEQISQTAEDWRRDRIRVRIAQTHALMGELSKAEGYEVGVVESESGKVAGTRALVADSKSFDELMQEIDPLLASQHFDVLRNALFSCVEYYGKFYADAEKRTAAETKIRSAWGGMTPIVKIEILRNLASASLKNSDFTRAVELIEEAQQIIDAHEWPPEYFTQITAKLLELRFKAGDRENAEGAAKAALERYDREEMTIINIDRAGALRPLAEAYSAGGETDLARSIFKRAVEKGVENPNSRPRAEDLSATCLSMALSATEPDEELWTRIRQIREALGDPW